MGHEKGLSLIELMIALALSSFLMLGVYKVFDLHQRGFQLIVDLNDREDNAQLALNLLSSAISMSGHWGGVDSSKVHVDTVHLSATPGACQSQWIFDVTTGLKGLEGASSVSQIHDLPAQCIQQGEYIESSDMLAVRFADSRQYFSDQEIDNKRYTRHVFMRSQAGQAAMLFQGKRAHTAIAALPDTGFHYNMPFSSSLYFLKPCKLNSLACDQTETVLTRLSLSGDRYVQQSLVEGIQQLQFEYGVDDNGDRWVDRYLNAKEVTDWQRVKSVRIFLLARSRMRDTSLDESGQIYLMNSDASPLKAHYRVPAKGRYYRYKLYQRDVVLKNHHG